MGNINVALIFLLSGLKLKTGDIFNALKSWKEVLFGVIFILFVSPLLGMALVNIKFNTAELAMYFHIHSLTHHNKEECVHSHAPAPTHSLSLSGPHVLMLPPHFSHAVRVEGWMKVRTAHIVPFAPQSTPLDCHIVETLQIGWTRLNPAKTSYCEVWLHWYYQWGVEKDARRNVPLNML